MRGAHSARRLGWYRERTVSVGGTGQLAGGLTHIELTFDILWLF